MQDTGNSEKQQMRKQRICHCGDNIVQGPPVLIPNTEVKLHRADGTVRDTVWESRTLPHFQCETGVNSTPVFAVKL